MSAIATRPVLDTFYMVRVVPDKDPAAPEDQERDSYFHAILPQDRAGTWLDCPSFGEQHVRTNFNENTEQVITSGEDRRAFDLKISGLGGAFCDAGRALHFTPQCDM